MLSQVPVSRSVLQRRFRSLLGRSIHGMIAGVRLQHAKRLLLETDLTLSAIAQRTGFSHVEYLCAAFRQATGVPPGTTAGSTRVAGHAPERADEERAR